MTCSEAQMIANRRNAERSTGPKTEAGKLRSRTNATKHAMAGLSSEVEAGLSPEFLDRRERWAEEFPPEGLAANAALDQLVTASFRIERCERSLESLTSASQERARLAWDQDRAVEAAKIAGRLAKDPVLASRELHASLAGVVLMIEWWLFLGSRLETGADWSESETARALDLLGVAIEFRSGRLPIDPYDGSDPVAYRLALAQEKLKHLESLRDKTLGPLDEIECRRAMTGDDVLATAPAKLILRYEREAYKRHRDALRELKAAAPVVDQPASLAPRIGARPTPPPPPEPQSRPTVAATSREVPPTPADRAAVTAALIQAQREARLDRLNPRRLDLPTARPGEVVPIAASGPNLEEATHLGTERTQFRPGH